MEAIDEAPGCGMSRPVSESFALESASGYLVRRGLQQLNSAWADTGPSLTIPQFSILLELDRHPGLDQRTLAEQVWIDTSTVADVCRRLVARGQLKRHRDAADNRRYVLHLTESGRETLREALPRVEAVNDRLIANLNPAERRQFTALFQKALGLVPECDEPRHQTHV